MKHDEDVQDDLADKGTHCSVLTDGEPTGRRETQLHQRNEECQCHAYRFYDMSKNSRELKAKT